MNRKTIDEWKMEHAQNVDSEWVTDKFLSEIFNIETRHPWTITNDHID